jgi:hypothetical protein
MKLPARRNVGLKAIVHACNKKRKKGLYKERLRRDLLIASQRVLLLAACNKQNRRKFVSSEVKIKDRILAQ